jgi:dTDP-4-amino-4,6-dideoxygalactose transaminase
MAKLAINGGSPVRTAPWPKWPEVDERDVAAVSEVIRSGRWGRLGGTKAAEFEQKFAAYQGAKYGLGVSSGTAALEIALRAMKLGPGDEVIVPPYTFMATATAVLQVGAIPIFVDIDPRTYNIDPALIEAAVNERTKAIIPVHFGGLPCDMEAIMAVAKKHNLLVLEDCSHSHGGRWKDKGLGSIGDAGAFSLMSGKNLAAGEAGIIITDSAEIIGWSILFHDFWRGAVRAGSVESELPSGWLVRFPVLAGNERMNEIEGALLLSQMEKLEDQAQRRSRNGDYLNKLVEGIEGLRPLRTDDYVTRNVYHILTLQYTGEGFKGLSREKFSEALNAEGIGNSLGYLKTVYQHPIFLEAATALPGGFPVKGGFYGREVDYNAVRCTQAERLCHEETLWFGQSMFLGTTKDMDDVAEAIAKIKANVSELL